jgi:hypothetical protein
VAESTTTTWSCDRCGTAHQMERNEQPQTWSRLTSASPPRSAEPGLVGDLCVACHAEFVDWWAEGRRIDRGDRMSGAEHGSGTNSFRSVETPDGNQGAE